MIAAKRPVVAPTSLLTFYALALLVQFSVASATETDALNKIAHSTVIGVGVISALVILDMPTRNPFLSKDGIGEVGETPSDTLRSPEDNLRLWQFLTVSWMSPLISIGRKRRINEDDVWSLGFEFQHRGLHEKFRQLQGSVLGRLMQANGIDIFIISTISLVQIVCSEFWLNWNSVN